MKPKISLWVGGVGTVENEFVSEDPLSEIAEAILKEDEVEKKEEEEEEEEARVVQV